MLDDIRRDMKFYAGLLPKPYEDYSIDDLADKYCEATDTGNEDDKNIYIAALTLRFWNKISQLAGKNKNLSFEITEFYCWLIEAIEYACKYRKWQTDPKLNAQQCINQCIGTIVVQHYYQYNLDIHKANMPMYQVSMDTPIDDDSERSTLENLLGDDAAQEDQSDLAVISLIQNFVDSNKVVEAIILDNIAFNDVFKHSRKAMKGLTTEGEKYNWTEVSSEFWPFRLVQTLNALPEDYRDSFMRKYSTKPVIVDAALEALSRATNQRKYKYLDQALKTAKTLLI